MSEAQSSLGGQDVQAFFLGPFVDCALEVVTRAKVDEALLAQGVHPSLVEDRNAWVPLHVMENCMVALAELSGDPLIARTAGRAAVSPKYAGILRTIVRAVGSTESAYRWLAEASARFNKVGSFTYSVEPTGTTLVYRAREGAPAEQNVIMCQTRSGNLEAIPTLFDLPYAKISHPTCIHRGDETCVYRIEHKSRPRDLWPLVAFLAGLALGVALGWPNAWFSLCLGASLGVSGYALGAMRSTRRVLASATATVNEQHDALNDAAIEHEARFAELSEAKAAVEQKVEERTLELQQTTEQLAETLAQVQNLSQARADFFANVSHELRTPLTLMVAPLSLLIRGEEPAGGQSAALQAMERNADRLLRTINQLLDLARVESGETRLERAPVSLSDLLAAVHGSFAAAAKVKSVSLEVESFVLSPMSLDATWLETALTNLVANALKFTGEGGSITITAVDQGDEIVLRVSDTGQGIAAEKLDSLFERFRRGAGPGAGSGIGLSLVHEAARLHGGSAEVSSVLGEGSTFRLRLPRVLGSGPVVTHDITAAPAVSDDCPSSEGPGPSAPLALVAEDNPDVRRFMVDVLAAQYRVVSVRNGEEALAAIGQARPDILISDIAMPEMSGLELAARLRSDRALPDLPILLVTARGEPAQVLEGFEAGADDYVVKPFHGRELLARTGALVRARRMAGRLVHQERLAAVGMVAASVAHHIRNPLNALIGGLPAVRSRLENLDAGTERMFDVFIECADRIENVTTDLLDLSRVDREELCEFKPGRGLAASLRLMETRFGDAIRIEGDIDEDTVVLGRAGDLHHVFLNILDNAARAMGAKGNLSAQGHRDEAWYVVRIEDDGPGIPDALIATVFEHFVTTRPAGEGTGLGLAIARDIVQAHRGSIQVGRSSLGGALVELRLPIA